MRPPFAVETQRVVMYVLFAAFAVSCNLAAQEKPTRWTPEVMMHFKRVGGTAVSPDGRMVAYTVSVPLMEGEKSEFLTHVWVVSADGKTNRQVTRGEKSCTAPAFSPDGRSLAFLSARGTDGKNQVWVIPLDGGEAERLTDAKSGVSAFGWSPDGGRIAYTMTDPETPAEESARKEKRDMRVVDGLIKYAHLYTVSLKDRTTRRLTSCAFHVTSFDWSPDGKTIVFEHQATPSADDWLTADISAVPSAGGETAPLVRWKGADRFPLHSPDGRSLAFVSDGGEPSWALFSDVYIMPAKGGEPKRLAPTPDRNFTYYGRFIGWSGDSREVYVNEASRTFWSVFVVPLEGDARKFTAEPATFADVSLSRNGKWMAFIRQTSEEPPDVYLSSIERFAPARLTGVNADFPKLPLGRTEVITWKAKDGLEIEGLLTYPVSYTKGRRYPLILNVHGGPASFFRQSFTAAGDTYPIQAFAQEGYAVLRPNPRGSSGYGKEFRYANLNDWGFGDFDDLMAGVDAVVAMGVAHPDSLCITGWSYGGYMTAFAVTRTNRFKAASMGAGLSNLVSFTGTADIHSFIPEYFGGEVWNRADIYMEHSAIWRVKEVTTPVLILHGESDVRVPISQGYEFYHALKRLGRTTEMVVYPRAQHGLSEPKFIIDAGERTLAWFNRCLRGK